MDTRYVNYVNKTCNAEINTIRRIFQQKSLVNTNKNQFSNLFQYIIARSYYKVCDNR